MLEDFIAKLKSKNYAIDGTGILLNDLNSIVFRVYLLHKNSRATFSKGSPAIC